MAEVLTRYVYLAFDAASIAYSKCSVVL